MMLGVGFLYMAFITYMMSYVSSVPNLLNFFFFYHMASMGTNQNHPVFFFFRLNIFTLMKSTKEGI